MRSLFLAAFALLIPCSAVAHAASRESRAVMVPIHDFFTGLAHHDREALLQQVIPQGLVTSWRNGELRYLTFSDLVNIIAQNTHAIEEPIGDPLIRTDETVAMVWVPYAFLTDGKTDHCGTDVFTLLKLHGTWRIVSATDNARTACADWKRHGKL